MTNKQSFALSLVGISLFFVCVALFFVMLFSADGMYKAIEHKNYTNGYSVLILNK